MSTKPHPLAISVQRDLRNNNGLSVILAYDKEDSSVIEENTTQASNASVASHQYAAKITPSDIQLTTTVPQKLKINNSVLGRYRHNSADLAGTNSPLWVYDNAIFVVLGQDGWRSDLYDGNVKPIEGFSDISGKVAQTSEGIYYQCVNVLPTEFGANAGSRYSLTTRQDLVDKYDKNSTSVSRKSTATNICGVGSETRIGNCCLYYSNTTKDTVSGVTFAAGDFYDCMCTQCHKCLEVARKLDMKYVFKAHAAVAGSLTGGTGPSCQCMADFPNDCGPCSCRIPTPDVVDRILGDRNISSESTDNRNALISKNNELAGGFVGVWMNLTGIPEESRVLHDDYQKNGSLFGETIQLPLRSSVPATDVEEIYHVQTYRGSNDKIYVRGLSLIQSGVGYVDAEIDSAKWATICPGIPATAFTTHITPFGGFFADIPESTMFNTQVRITKRITGSELQNAGVRLDSLKLNRAIIGTLATASGEKVFDDLESGEQGSLSLQTLVDIEKTDGSDFDADILATSGSKSTLEVGFSKGGEFQVPPPAFSPPPVAPSSVKSTTTDAVSTAKFKTPGDLSTIELVVDTVNPESYSDSSFVFRGEDVTSTALTRAKYNDENLLLHGTRIDNVLTSKLPTEINFETMTNKDIETFTFTVETIIG